MVQKKIDRIVHICQKARHLALTEIYIQQTIFDIEPLWQMHTCGIIQDGGLTHGKIVLSFPIKRQFLMSR